MSALTLTLSLASPSDLRQMMSWFPTAQACLVWGGTAFRFPFSEDSFLEDSRLAELPSYVLLGPGGELRAFGQCSLRSGRCHLGRLAIAPEHRGHGIGTHLVRTLAAQGCTDLGTTECSLFVAPANPRARALYERLGFRVAPYPDEGFDASAYDYMIIAASKLLAPI